MRVKMRKSLCRELRWFFAGDGWAPALGAAVLQPGRRTGRWRLEARGRGLRVREEEETAGARWRWRFERSRRSCGFAVRADESGVSG